jgi:hypothetical protein
MTAGRNEGYTLLRTNQALPIRQSNVLTFPTPHSPPRSVWIPRALRSAAIARSEASPLARMSAITGARQLRRLPHSRTPLH